MSVEKPQVPQIETFSNFERLEVHNHESFNSFETSLQHGQTVGKLISGHHSSVAAMKLTVRIRAGCARMLR